MALGRSTFDISVYVLPRSNCQSTRQIMIFVILRICFDLMRISVDAVKMGFSNLRIYVCFDLEWIFADAPN